MNWLRAKARYDRWEEEHNMVRHEMEWTVKYFEHREQQWEGRRCAVSEEEIGASGLRCYAAKQAGLWRTFAERAKALFRGEIPDVHNTDL